MTFREKAARILSEHLGWHVTADMIRPVTGFWKKMDVYRWEVNVPDKGIFGCWETLKEFCFLASCNGCELVEYTIYAKENPVKKR